MEEDIGDTPGSEFQSHRMLPEALLVLGMGQVLSREMVLGSDSDPWLTNSKTGAAIVPSAQSYHDED